jgi:hypothetical protein
VKLLVVQAMLMFVTFALATVPESLVTVHVWLGSVGWVSTLTAYAAPLASCVRKVNAVALGFTGRFSLPFRRSMSPDPVRPVIDPPIVSVAPVPGPVGGVLFPPPPPPPQPASCANAIRTTAASRFFMDFPYLPLPHLDSTRFCAEFTVFHVPSITFF